MLSKKEKLYLKGRIYSKDYKYVLKHRIGDKLLEFERELDLFLDSKEYFKEWLKAVFENFIKRYDNLVI